MNTNGPPGTMAAWNQENRAVLTPWRPGYSRGAQAMTTCESCGHDEHGERECLEPLETCWDCMVLIICGCPDGDE